MKKPPASACVNVLKKFEKIKASILFSQKPYEIHLKSLKDMKMAAQKELSQIAFNAFSLFFKQQIWMCVLAFLGLFKTNYGLSNELNTNQKASFNICTANFL